MNRIHFELTLQQVPTYLRKLSLVNDLSAFQVPLFCTMAGDRLKSTIRIHQKNFPRLILYYGNNEKCLDINDIISGINRLSAQESPDTIKLEYITERTF